MSVKAIVEFKVEVKTWDGKATQPGKISVESWNKSQRTKRALKTLGMGWGLAVISVFLPAAHFILVPSFLLGSPVAAYFVSKQGSVVLGGESICPYCLKPLAIAKGSEKWPLEDVCTACQNHVLINKI